MKIYCKLDAENYIVGYQMTKPINVKYFTLIELETNNIILNKHKIIDGLLIESDTYSKGYLISQEKVRLKQLRDKRKIAFAAFDIYKSNIEYGIITESDYMHENIIYWYNACLSLNSEAINNIPEVISKYVK